MWKRLWSKKVNHGEPVKLKIDGKHVYGIRIKYYDTTKLVLIDILDWPKVKQFRWAIWNKPKERTLYCTSEIYNTELKRHCKISLHRFLLGLRPGDKRLVDHHNGNGLDNRRCNLRRCNQFQNLRNRKPNKNRKYGCHKGVTYHKNIDRWVVAISLGTYKTEKEAAQAYNKGAKKIYGRFAYLNKVKQ